MPIARAIMGQKIPGKRARDCRKNAQRTALTILAHAASPPRGVGRAVAMSPPSCSASLITRFFRIHDGLFVTGYTIAYSGDYA
jgi:hypothetical protein